MKSAFELFQLLSQGVQKGAEEFARAAKEVKYKVIIINDGEGLNFKIKIEGSEELIAAKDSYRVALNDYYQAEEIREEDGNLEELEKESIKRALERSDWNRKVAAEALGFSTRTLNRKIKEYNIQK